MGRPPNSFTQAHRAEATARRIGDLHPAPVPDYPEDHRQARSRDQLREPDESQEYWWRAVEGAGDRTPDPPDRRASDPDGRRQGITKGMVGDRYPMIRSAAAWKLRWKMQATAPGSRMVHPVQHGRNATWTHHRRARVGRHVVVVVHEVEPGRRSPARRPVDALEVADDLVHVDAVHHVNLGVPSMTMPQCWSIFAETTSSCIARGRAVGDAALRRLRDLVGTRTRPRSRRR